ncbi:MULTISPECIES: hypothetical protein [unclassified Psychrobacter]|uniref:hypothetical protein n=1 Tax=unclassified Psychrobacter TaxID=196806 RepID=UPI000472C86B|nr:MULTISPECIES: hypothetical protein [unclassified Psychrobacter]
MSCNDYCYPHHLPSRLSVFAAMTKSLRGKPYLVDIPLITLQGLFIEQVTIAFKQFLQSYFDDHFDNFHSD